MSSRPLIARLRTYIRPWFIEMRCAYFRRMWGMTIGRNCNISMTARLDKTNPRGVHIGDETSVSFEAAILTHDFVNLVHKDVHIGKQCLIGARSIIFAGVTIGDNCIVSAASVVMKDVPPHSLVAGNPARVMESNIETGRWGSRLSALNR
jgi:acetyltransferase-like isoleucine patch superfamily enzyme